MEIEAVKCDRCEKIFEVNSSEYFSIHGNVFIGKGGGLIGNNLDKENRVIRENHFCRNCLKVFLFDETERSEERIKEHTPSKGFIDEDLLETL